MKLQFIIYKQFWTEMFQVILTDVTPTQRDMHNASKYAVCLELSLQGRCEWSTCELCNKHVGSLYILFLISLRSLWFQKPYIFCYFFLQQPYSIIWSHIGSHPLWSLPFPCGPLATSTWGQREQRLHVGLCMIVHVAEIVLQELASVSQLSFTPAWVKYIGRG